MTLWRFKSSKESILSRFAKNVIRGDLLALRRLVREQVPRMQPHGRWQQRAFAPIPRAVRRRAKEHVDVKKVRLGKHFK